MNNTTTTKFSLLHRARAWWARQQDLNQRKALERSSPTAVAAARLVPVTVRGAWAAQAARDFPGLDTGDTAWLRCATALAQFFEVCRLQQALGPCALPSLGADSVWHAWLDVDPAGLAAWQQRCFGRTWLHREADTLGAPVEDCLARTWAGACKLQQLSPLGPRLPLLFTQDRQLRVPTGWAYHHERGALVHRQIDGFGDASGPAVVHAAITAGGLVTLGLLTHEELRAHRRRSDAGSGCGSGGSADGGSCDAGSGCGSGCGSSCGSGCGGGGD